MHIQQLQLDRIGVHRDVSVDQLNGGFNVILGGPGTGKSTLSDLVRSLIFGYQRGAIENTVTTGSATVAGAGGRYRVSRRWLGAGPGELNLQPIDADAPPRTAESLLPHVSDRMFDKLLHVSFRRGYDINGAVAEAESSLSRHRQAPFELSELERRLAAEEGRRADWLRSDGGASPLDEAAKRRETLLAEIASLEDRWSRQSETQGRRRIELEQLITVREGSLADANRRIDGIDAEIDQIEVEHQELLKQYEELQQTTDAELSGELQAKLKKITEQMLRWNRVLADVVERRDRIRTELVEWATGDGHAELGGPAKRIADMEQLIAQVKAEISVFRSKKSAAPNCGCRDLHDDCRGQLNELRDHLYELCEELSRQQYKFRRNAMNSELKQLRRCHGEVTQYLQRLVKRRNQLLRRLGETDPCALSRIVREQSELCEVEDNEALFDLVSIKSFDFATDWEAVQRRLGEIDFQLEELRTRRVELNRDAEAHRTSIGQLRAELNEIGPVQDVDASLADRRLQLERLDSQHALLMNQWREINDAIHMLSRQIEQLQAASHTVDILADASHYLRELTSGDFVTARRSLQSSRVVLDHRNGKTYTWEALDQEARDLAHLSVCLAAATHMQRDNVSCPLILDDLFTHIREDRVPQVASVLKRFAETGNQVIATTGWESAAVRCESIGVNVRSVSRAAIVQPPVAEPQPQVETFAAPREVAAIDPEPVTQPTFGDGIPDDTYYLERTDPIEEAPEIEHEAAVALRAHGVDSVGDLLDVTADDLAAWSDVRLNSAQLRHCQSSCRLLCDVINLRPYDVRILVGAGIHDAQQLRRMTSEQLLSKVEGYIRTNEGRAILVSGDDFELARVANWIRSARESREFHRESERQQALRRSKEQSRQSDLNHLTVYGRQRRESERRFQPRDTERRTTKTRASKSRSKPQRKSEPAAMTHAKLKFHLDRDNDVEAAPSIGPKMAEHLAKIRIVSVGDLLDHDAESIANQLDHRRVNTETVRQWQRQAEWVCRVPELRGHDAQLLVASGYDNVEDLEGVDPSELFAAVQEIIDTKEGKRILRGGAEPDLDEIKDWLEWSKHSRRLRAA